VLYGLGTIVFLALLGFAWNWYQDVQHTLRDVDGLRSVRLGTPTPSGARGVPTPMAIALASPSPTLTPTPEPSPTPLPTVDGIQVDVRTTARVYVEAAVDGQAAMAETLGAGTQRSLPLAKDSVLLRASNGSAVEVTVNNTPQPVPEGNNPVELSWHR
jgi:cytoskeletal protein RodZ